MKTHPIFVRNSFALSRNLSFTDAVLAASRASRWDGERYRASFLFEYEKGSPSYPGDVLADGSRCLYAEAEEFTLTASGSVDDQATISVSGGGSYSSPSGAGVEINGSLQGHGAGYHSLVVMHTNISYPPNQNVSFIHCEVSGSFRGAEPVPVDNEPEEDCEDDCTCAAEETEAGGMSPDASTRAGADDRAGNDLSTTSGGSEVSRRATPTTMAWSCRFGSFRGLAGLPVARLEILAHEDDASLATPAGLAVRHPLAMFLSMPENGVAPNELVRLNDGASYTNYVCEATGEEFFAVGASARSLRLLAPVSDISLDSSVVCPLDSAAYIRASLQNGSAVFFSPQSGECMAYLSRWGNVLTSQEALACFAVVRTGEEGTIRQVWNLWDGLADVVPEEGGGGYTISIYPPAQVTPPAEEGELYTTTGQAVRVFRVVRDEAASGIRMSERDAALPERTPDFVTSWSFAGGVWSISTGTGEEAISETRTRSQTQTDEAESRYTVETVLSRGGVVASRTRECYVVQSVGRLLTERTEGYGSDTPLTTTYAYDNKGRLISEISPMGAETVYRYDRQGRPTVMTEPWGANGRRSTETTYRPDTEPYSLEPSQVVTKLLTPSRVGTLRTDQYTYAVSDGVKRVECLSSAAGSSLRQLTVTETWEGTVENVYARGRVRMTQDVNGVQTLHTYAASTKYGALYTETIETQVAGAAVPGQSERTVHFITPEGNTVRSERYVMLADSTWALISGRTNSFDTQNRLISSLQDSGRGMSQALNCQGDPLWQVDEEGIRTDYVYNAARQLIETTRSEVSCGGDIITPETITEYERDAAGRTLSVTTRTGAMTTVSRTAYDLAGRVTSETDVLGRVTSTSYAENGRIRTVVLPSGATLISTFNPDGTVAQESGTGQRELYHVYDFNNGHRETVRLSDDTTILSQTIRDGFGQIITQTAPTTLENTYLYTRSVYNALGQRTRQTRGNLAPTTWEYDSMGYVTRETLLLNSSAPTDATRNRITTYAYGYETAEDGVYRVITITSHNAAGGELVSVQRELISQLSATLADGSSTTDPLGNTSVQWTEYTAPAVRTHYSQIPTSDATATSIVADGFTTESTDNENIHRTFTRAWTEEGLLLTDTDGRGNTTVTRTDVAERPLSVTDAAGNETLTEYSPFNDQPGVVTNALGRTSCYRYDIRNRKVAEYGTALQPALFEYDEADNLIALTTFRVDEGTLTDDPTGREDGDTTRWEYSPATGLELTRTYPDGTTHITSYDAMNRVATVTDARGIVRTCNYATATGLLTGITFSDDTAPQAFEYNILGQLTKVTDAAGVRTFTYNTYTQQERENIRINTTDFPIEEFYDDYGRNSGYILHRGTSNQQSVSYGYNTLGQLSTTTFLHSGGEKTFIHHYLEGTRLPEQLDSPNGMTRHYTYEEKRDLIASLIDKRGSVTVVERSYSYNALGIPTTCRVARQGTVRYDTFTHNDRNELTAATMGAADYAYTYDNIGNRKTAQEEADAFTYTANELNQYTHIAENSETFEPEYDADGNQTRIKTTTGIWRTTYNALNRPLSFERQNEDGTKTVVTADYDYMGRRVYKKVETITPDPEGGNDIRTITLHQRYLYRGYLQIATLDLTRSGLNSLWLITWDPTEPVATRPLALQKDGTWYTYGIDLPKNVTEIFSNTGGIRTAYTYTPYGEVTSRGNVTQPIQWSSEYNDTELGMVYYNYRHYNPLDGRWVSRDSMIRKEHLILYVYCDNDAIEIIDYLGLVEVKAGANMGTGTNQSEDNLFQNIANAAGNGKKTPTGEELLDHLTNLSSNNSCISLFTIAGHGWSSWDGQSELNEGDGIPGDGDGVGIYLDNSYDENLDREQGGRTLSDLENMISNGRICFCKNCRIQIHSCNISSGFAEKLGQITKCSVVYAMGSCSPRKGKWHSGVGEEPGTNNKDNGFYMTEGGAPSKDIGNYYSPKK